jgi:hypothetical protein
MQRGNKRIINYHDERLGKTILLGNENIRPYSAWKTLFEKAGFAMPLETLHYVRLYPPFLFKGNSNALIEKEQQKWKSNSFLRERFFFGLDFCAIKNR